MIKGHKGCLYHLQAAYQSTCYKVKCLFKPPLLVPFGKILDHESENRECLTSIEIIFSKSRSIWLYESQATSALSQLSILHLVGSFEYF